KGKAVSRPPPAASEVHAEADQRLVTLHARFVIGIAILELRVGVRADRMLVAGTQTETVEVVAFAVRARRVGVPDLEARSGVARQRIDLAGFRNVGADADGGADVAASLHAEPVVGDQHVGLALLL